MKLNLMLKACFSIGLICSIGACDHEPKPKELPFSTQEEYEQTMILSHREFLKKEKAKIEDYIKKSEHQFEKTGTGLQYSIYEKAAGDAIKKGDAVIITYRLKSIEGEELYASPEGKYQEFVVDYDNVESGLHEGIKKMKVGEKAIFILPAHLAHGITGDQAAIPSQTTLVYDVFLAGKR